MIIYIVETDDHAHAFINELDAQEYVAQVNGFIIVENHPDFEAGVNERAINSFYGGYNVND